MSARRTGSKKIVTRVAWSIFMLIAWAAFSFAQSAPQSGAAAESASPRKASVDFVREFQRAKKMDAQLAAETNALLAKQHDRKVFLRGLAEELAEEMRRVCSDVAQGCRYDEALGAFVPLAPSPKAQAGPPPAAKPAAPEPPKAQPPAAKNDEPKADEK